MSLTSVLVRGGKDTRDMHTEERPHEDTVKRQQSASQEERPQEKPNLDFGLLGSRTVRK